MDTNWSGNHPQVQVAAGRAVGGGPPLSAAAANASCLPPPAPSAPDAAVQPGAGDGSPDDPPPSNPADIEDVPMHPSQIATDFEKKEAIKVPHIVKREEILQHVQDPPTPGVAQAPSPPPADQGRSPSSPRGPQQISPRPPPQSTMPFIRDPPVSALTRDPSVPMLRATPVQDEPELPVYDAVQVAEQTRLEKNKKIIIGVGAGLLIGAVAVGVSVSSDNGSSDGNTIVPEPKGVLLSTALPSEPLSPSQFPSLRPTLRPSQSTNPSQPPSRSFRPSLSPSVSASPTPFCFGGEINILTDADPDETSWRISKLDNVDGFANSKAVLEGSPVKKEYRTSDKVCLERGDYEFAIFDSGGDGIASPGYYDVAFDGVLIAQGGAFESEERVSFSLPLASPSPSQFPSASFQPSESSIPSQSLSPSLQPSNSFSPSTYWSSLEWNRQGLGLNGDASEDQFGSAVAFSADASTMAVGASDNWFKWGGPGHVKVYRHEVEGSSWEQRGKTIVGDVNGDNFGGSLSLSQDGTTLSIGAVYNDNFGRDSGLVKVYKWDEATLDYVQIGETLYGEGHRRYGYSLDISNGKILAVGARSSNADSSGQVIVYAWDDASSDFKQRGETLNGSESFEEFGSSLSLSGNGQKLAVGAIYADSNGRDAGKVRVFEWDETTSNYVRLGDSLVGDAPLDWFGYSVYFSHDGTTLAIGASRNSKNGQHSGQVKVFAWDEAALNFDQIGQSLYGRAADDEFGWSVALSSEGKTLAIGANQYFKTEPNPGYVEVYGWDEAASEYKLLGQSLRGEASEDHFGEALALAANGRVLAVGAPLNDRNGTDSGRVEVFDLKL